MCAEEKLKKLEETTVEETENAYEITLLFPQQQL